MSQKEFTVLLGEAAEFACHSWRDAWNKSNVLNRWFIENNLLDGDDVVALCSPDDEDYERALANYKPSDTDGLYGALEVVTDTTTGNSGVFGKGRRLSPTTTYRQVIRIDYADLEFMADLGVELDDIYMVGELIGYKFDDEKGTPALTATFKLVGWTKEEEGFKIWNLIQTQEEYRAYARKQKKSDSAE